VLNRRKGKSFEGMLCKFMASFGFISVAVVGYCSSPHDEWYFFLVLFALMFGFFGALGTCLQSYISPDLTAAIPYVITILMMVYVVVRSQNKKKSLRLRKEKAL
jgi:ABC-type uncharacterized transport system permease subunit